MPSIPSVRLSMRADSVVSALGKNNFNKAAKAFFNLANESGLESCAIVSLESAVNKAAKEATTIKPGDKFLAKARKFMHRVTGEKKSNLFENILDGFEKVAKEDKTFFADIEQFSQNILKKYPKTLSDRRLIAKEGLVRAETLHKPSLMEKFMASVNKITRIEE